MDDFRNMVRKGVVCPSLGDTTKLAADFAAYLLKSGGDEILISLSGDLGSGKTAFVKGMARALGVSETVKSPSFNICCIYGTADKRRLVHVDAYRLSGREAFDGLLIDELAPAPRIVCVEWPESVGLSGEDFRLKFEVVGENSRRIIML